MWSWWLWFFFFGICSTRPRRTNSVRWLCRERINLVVILCNHWPHQNESPRCWTLNNTFNLGPWGCCKWDPDLHFSSGRGKLSKCGSWRLLRETFPPPKEGTCFQTFVRGSKGVIPVGTRNARYLKRVCWPDQGVRYQHQAVAPTLQNASECRFPNSIIMCPDSSRWIFISEFQVFQNNSFAVTEGVLQDSAPTALFQAEINHPSLTSHQSAAGADAWVEERLMASNPWAPAKWLGLFLLGFGICWLAGPSFPSPTPKEPTTSPPPPTTSLLVKPRSPLPWIPQPDTIRPLRGHHGNCATARASIRWSPISFQVMNAGDSYSGVWRMFHGTNE